MKKEFSNLRKWVKLCETKFRANTQFVMNRVDFVKNLLHKISLRNTGVGRVISSHHESHAPKLPTKWRCWNRNPTQVLRKEKTDRK